MLEFSQALKLLEFDQKRHTKTLDRIMGQCIREAAREWLRAWMRRNKPPVETGMARAALKPLGRFLRVAVPISPTRKPYYSKLEGVMQEPASGEAASYHNIDDDRNHPGRFTEYRFEWATDIHHYYEAAFYRGIPGEEEIEHAKNDFFNHLNWAIEHRVPKTLREFVKIAR